MNNNKFVIFQITPASYGGIGRLTEDIFKNLSDDKYEKHIAFARGHRRNADIDYQFGKKKDVFYHALLTRLTDRIGCFSKNATYQLVDYMKSCHVDLVHLHNLHGYYINLKILFDALKDLDVPVVWTLHDCWSFTGHCTYFSFIGCDRWKTCCYDCPQKNCYPQTFVDNSRKNYLFKKSVFCSLEKLTIVTPSEWLKELVKESFLGKLDVLCFNNGINIDVFRVKENIEYTIPTQKKIVLGLASSFGERKGFTDFIELSKLLPDDFQIVMVGVTSKQLEKLPSNIIGITHTENVEQLVDIYNSAFLFLNLTYEDNFPTTNIEAMACGTSVLTYKTGGSVESLSEKTGYIVPQHDLKDVVSIIKTHKKTQDSIYACRKRAEIFSRENAFMKYEKLYNKLLCGQ